MWRDENMVIENDSAVSVQNMLNGLNGKLQVSIFLLIGYRLIVR